VLDSLASVFPDAALTPAELTVLLDAPRFLKLRPRTIRANTFLRFPEPWAIHSRHIIRFAYDIRSNSAEQRAIAFSADAFDLPAESWTPALPPRLGCFRLWRRAAPEMDLVVRVPQAFSSREWCQEKHSATNVEMEFRFEQTARTSIPS